MLAIDTDLQEELGDFQADFAHEWDEELPQPPQRCVDHLCSCILRWVDAKVGKSNGAGTLSSMTITEEKARKFRLIGQKVQEDSGGKGGKASHSDSGNAKASAPSASSDPVASGERPNGGVQRKKSVNEIKIRKRASAD